MNVAGHIVEVSTDRIGDALIVDHPAGATVLTVNSTVDFEGVEQVALTDDAGTVYLLPLLDFDEEVDTLTLGSGLPVAFEAETFVEVWPIASERRALVVVDEGDEPISAVLAHHLIDKVPEGTRGPGEEESVSISDESGEWVVDNVLGLMPVTDGSFILPETIPALPYEPPIVLTAPTVSPAITRVAGLPTALLVVVGPIRPEDELEYHLSTVEGFVPTPGDPATLVLTRTKTTVGTLGVLPVTAAPLDPEVTYYVSVIARNDAGSAPASPAVEGRLDLSAIERVVALQVVAGFVLAGELGVGPISITPDGGIVIPSGDGRQTVLKAGESSFVGEATLDAVTVMGKMTINGLTNFINGLVTLRSGVGDPLQRPNVTATHEVGVINGDPNDRGFNRRGMAAHPNGTAFAMTDYVMTTGGVQVWLNTGGYGGNFDLPAGWLPVGGVTVCNNRYYTLCAQAVNGGDWQRTGFRVYVHELDGTLVAYQTLGISCAGSGTSRPMIGQVGGTTNYIVAYVNGGTLSTAEYNASGVLQANRTLSTTWGTADVCGVARQPVPPAAGGSAGSVRTVVASPTGVYVWDSTNNPAARVAAEDWLPSTSAFTISGISLGTDGFWHSTTGAAFTAYTQNSGAKDFAYSWADTDAGGLGLAETKVSPPRSIAPRRMAKWVVTLPDLPPDDGTTDGADSAYVYVGPTGSLVRQGVLSGGASALTLASIASAGTAPPGSNGFATRPSTVIGRFASGATDGLGPLIDLKGDGAGRLGIYRVQANGQPVAGTAVAVGNSTAVTCDASGNAVITHGLGRTPLVAIANGPSGLYVVGVSAITATTFTINVRNNNGTATVFVGGISIRWMAL
jgi:hypothetical protein